MEPFEITPITKDIIIKFSGKEIDLSRDIQKKVNAYWNELIADGKKYKRGEVFTVTKKEVTNDEINILVEKTDYAHYLYCQNFNDLCENGVHIIHTSALVETFDDYFIFGEMGHQTSRSGIHQLCGGGIDYDDLRGEYFDLSHNIAKELLEELDIDVLDASRIAYFDKAYFKDGGPTDKMAVIHSLLLKETKDEFLKKYEKFEEQLRAQGQVPEFKKIVFLKKEKNEIKKFFSQSDIVFDEYMKPLFAYLEASF